CVNIFGTKGKKRGRVAWSATSGATDSGDSDSGRGSGDEQERSCSSRPKKRFIWPEELHRDFIAAVFDMGLKKADPSRLKEVLPKKERSLDAEVMKSHIQKLRSFRYQMKSTLAGDNLDTAEELAQKGILANGDLSVERRRNGSISLTRGMSENGDGVMMETEELKEAFEVPQEFASAIERLDGAQMKRSVELMGQCVQQVQRSAHGVLLHAIETQDNLKSAIMEKVRRMGLPAVSSTPSISGTAQASGYPFGGAYFPLSAVCSRSVASVLVVNGPSPQNVFPRAHRSKPSAPGSSSLSPTDGNGGGGATLSGGNRKVSSAKPLARRLPTVVQGLGAYAGVASMLQASAQSMQGPPLPQRRGLPVSANLFSFVPTPSAAVGGDSNQNTNANSLGAAVATRLASVASGVGGFSGAGVRLGLGLDAAGDVWESGILDGGGGGGILEALDETSLRMEMQTSIDMHRLMRSRQKNQIQLHAQQERQRQQQGDVGGGEGSRGKGESNGNSNANKNGNSTSGAGEFPVPASRSALGRASGASVAPGTQVAVSRCSQIRVCWKPLLVAARLFTSLENRRSWFAFERRHGRAPAPLETLTTLPPTPSHSPASRFSRRLKTSLADGVATPRSDGDTPTLMNADWNWDVDTLDEQLFSFLLDTPPSG
ncbi:unnamed protein product, partial [Scytosiphon promiscuus]